MRTIAILALTMMLACSSSSGSSTSSSDCFTGTYTVTFDTPTSNFGTPCPAIDSQTYIYARSGGGYGGSEPGGTTPGVGNTFDLNTCKAHMEFDGAAKTSDPATCQSNPEIITEDFQFTTAGFTGTINDEGICVVPDGGTAHEISCMYTVTATRN